MTTVTIAATVVPRGARHARPMVPDGAPVARLVLVVAAVGLASAYSLAALLDSWRAASPVGELAMVPLLALLLGGLAVRRHPFLGTVRPGRLDLLLGGAGVALVASVLVVGPVWVGNYFWATRLDLLAVPLLAASFVALLVGVRAVLAFLFPLAYLALAWPLPLLALLDTALRPITAVTSAGVRAALVVLPVATPVASDGDLTLRVAGPHAFEVAVASACSGVQGVVGIMLIGIAAMYVVRGSARRRLLWLATGVVAALVVNVLRILAIVAVGSVWGESAAIDVLHPVAGFLLLDAVALAMLLLLPRFGLTLRSAAPVVGDVPLTVPEHGAAPIVPGRFRRRAAAVIVVAALLGVADFGLRDAAGAFDNSGLPAAQPLSVMRSEPPGTTLTALGPYDWSRAYFGEHSSWRRFVLRPVTPRTGYTVWLDSIVTDDIGALHAHPLATCYRFHGFSTPVRQTVQLTHGVVAQRFVYVRRDGAEWHSLSWEWPVREADGKVVQERVVLFASSLRTVAVSAPEAALSFSIRGALLHAINRTRPDQDTNSAVSAALTHDAEFLVSRHLAQATATAEQP